MPEPSLTPNSSAIELSSEYFNIAASALRLTSSVRIVCISDTHAQHKYILPKSIPAGDLIVHTGDVCKTGSKNQLIDFADWFGNLPHPNKFLIGGNHDYCLEGTNNDTCSLETRNRILKNSGITLLHDQLTSLSGLNIYGTPWQLPFKQMAFNLEEAERLAKYDLIPEETHVLLTHNPPHGILDQSDDGLDNIGCTILRKKVDDLPNLQLCVFGHVHLGRGHAEINGKHYINASMVGGPGYSQRPFEISQKPFVVDLKI